MDRVVIVMPTYNEAKNIKRMIEELVVREFPKIKGVSMQLLVVDGNSPDGTGKIVQEASKKHKNVHLLTETEKRGLGMAYVSGFEYAIKKLKADAVMEMDADFQHPPRFVKPMVQSYLAGADYVIGSRYIKGGSVPADWAITRKAVSFLGNLFIRVVLLKPSLHDLTTGFRLTRVKGVLDKINLHNLMEPKRFAYKVDLLYQSIKNAKAVREVPLEFAARTEETSKFSTKEMVATFKVAIILGIRDKQRFIKFAMVGFIGYLINALGLEGFKLFILSAAIAAALATELAIISNFLLNNFWTFKEKKITNTKSLIRKFLQFNLTSMGAIVIQATTVGLATWKFGDTALVRQVTLFLTIPLLVIPYNYAMYNIFIWKTWKIPGLSKLQKIAG